MKNEIKEMINLINELVKISPNKGSYGISHKKWKQLLDYITNLQHQISLMEEDIRESKEINGELQQENEKNKEYIEFYKDMSDKWKDMSNIFKKSCDDYKSRCEKGIEYINKNKHLSMFADCREPEEEWNYDLECNANNLLNILQNGSDSQ